MIAASVDDAGLGAELQRQAAAAIAETERRATDAVQQGAARAASLAPVLSGELRSSIKARTHRRGGFKAEITGVYYWRFVEYGTVHAPPHPFVRPATAELLADFARLR